MVSHGVIPLQGIHDDPELGGVVLEVSIGHVHDKRPDRVLANVFQVGLLDPEKVVVGYLLLVFSRPGADMLLETGDRRVQVDQQVRLRQPRIDDVEQALVEPELLVGEGYLGEQQGLGKDVVRDETFLKQVAGVQDFLQLLVALGQEGYLQGETVLFRVLVEQGKERVVGKPLGDEPASVMIGQHSGQRAFAGPDIAFHGEERVLHPAKIIAPGQRSGKNYHSRDPGTCAALSALTG